MSLTLRISLISITLVAIVVILAMVRRKKLNLNYCIFWILTGIVLIISILIPHFIETISSFLGFERASNMIFCASIFVLFYLILNLTVIISKQNKEIIKLIQEVSILKNGISKEKQGENI